MAAGHGHVDQEGPFGTGLRPYVERANLLSQKAKRCPAEGAVLCLRLSLRECVASLVSQAKDVVALIDHNGPRHDDGAALVVSAGSAPRVIERSVINRHQRHLLGRVFVDVVGQFTDDLVFSDSHGASSPFRSE